MNTYIQEIMNVSDKVLRQRKIQKIINELISIYAKYQNNYPNQKTNKPLQDIKEIVDYFQNDKINLRKNEDELLRIASLDGETDFIKWLLKDSVCRHVPDVQTQLSAPLRFACINGHTDLVHFYLTDKDIKRSHINEANGCALGTVILQKNMKLVKLIMSQPEINIQIDHIRGIFKWDTLQQQEILTYIVTHRVKEKFFKRMVQYQVEMSEKIRELITDYKFVFTEEMKSSIKSKKDIEEIVFKKNFFYKLQNQLPTKGTRSRMSKI